MKIELLGGKKVTLEGFHMSPTYAGLITGTPTTESNEELVKRIRYPKAWGDRATLLKKSNRYVSENILKPIIYSAWVSSSEPINDTGNEFDGSDLVLIWFCKENLDMTLEDIIIYGIGLIDWDKNAENYQY